MLFYRKIILIISMISYFQPVQAQVVRVGIYDGPIDTDHSYLKSHINPEELRKIIPGPNISKQKNLLDHNNDIFQEGKKLLFNSQHKELVQNFYFNKVLPSASLLANMSEILEAIDYGGYFYHGTHVACLAAGSDDLIQIVPLPILLNPEESRKEFNQKDINLALEKAEQFGENYELDSQIEEMADLITINQINIINISVGIPSLKEQKENIQNKLKKLQESVDESIIDSYALLTLKRSQYKFKTLQNLLPGVVFVVAAGNLGMPLSYNPINFPSVKGPNTIVVGSLKKDDINKADFSNFDSELVDIAAPGEDIISGRALGHQDKEQKNLNMEMSGTSMSAPIVTHLLAKKLYENPQFNPPELIKNFLEDASIVKSTKDLQFLFSNGRYTLGLQHY